MKGRLAGRLLLHPAVIGALVVLIVNDHYLKEAHPGLVTGKLSDFAGLVVFPLLVVSVLDLGTSAISRNPRLVAGAVLIATGVVFAAIQLSPACAEAYRHIMGLAQLPLRSIAGGPLHGPVRHVADPSDLIALPALAAGWALFTHATDKGPGRSRRLDQQALREVPGHIPVGT